MRRIETLDFRDFQSGTITNKPTPPFPNYTYSFLLTPAVFDLPPELKLGYSAVILATLIAVISTTVERSLLRNNRPAAADAVSLMTGLFVRGSGVVAAGWLVLETVRRFA